LVGDEHAPLGHGEGTEVERLVVQDAKGQPLGLLDPWSPFGLLATSTRSREVTGRTPPLRLPCSSLPDQGRKEPADSQGEHGVRKRNSVEAEALKRFIAEWKDAGRVDE
jgi:hypothetical protein